MNKTDGLINLSGELCPECGYIHPKPENGICPVAANKGKTQDVKLKKIQHTNDDLASKKNIEIMKIKNMINKHISEKYDSIKFPNEYVEDKFFKNISELLEKNLIDYLKDYSC